VIKKQQNFFYLKSKQKGKLYFVGQSYRGLTKFEII